METFFSILTLIGAILLCLAIVSTVELAKRTIKGRSTFEWLLMINWPRVWLYYTASALLLYGIIGLF